MLELIRKYRALFSIIFVLAAVGMVVSMFGSQGVPGMGGMGMGSEVVAKVEGQPIQTRELLTALNRELEQFESMMAQQAGSDPQQEAFMKQFMRSQVNPERTLQRLIQRRFVVNAAQDSGIRTPPNAVRNYLQEMPEFQKDGRFDLLLYRQRVLRPAEFESEVEKQLLVDSFQKAVLGGLSVSSSREKADEGWINQKRVFEILSVNPSVVTISANPSQAQLEEYQKQADIPAKLQNFYNRHSANYNTSEEVHARHILVKETAATSIDVIEKEIKDGKISFEEAAKKYSEDASNAPKGGDLGFFGKGVMDPAFESAAFALKKPNEISAPVKSSFGMHLIQLVARKEATSRKLEEVKGEILPLAWKEDQQKKELTALLDSWTKKVGGPADAEVKKYQLTWQKQGPWSPLDASLGSLGNVDTYLKDLLALGPENKVLGKALSKGDGFALVRFVEFEKPTEAQLVAERKAGEAFEYFLKTRFEGLEKSKKIITSESVLNKVRQSVQEQL